MGLNKLGLRLLGVALVASLAACGEQENQNDDINHISRAKSYQDQGQYKAAMIEYKNAVKKSGGSTQAVVEYADMLNRLGHYSVALELLEQVAKDKDERYYLELVETFQGMHKYRSATELVEKHLDDSSADVQRLIGKNLLGLSEFEKSKRIFQGLLDKNPADNDALLNKAAALVRSGKTKEGIELLNRVDPKSDETVHANILLAGIQINDGNLEKAETILTDLLATMTNTDIMEPEKSVVLERLAYVLTRLGRSNEAYIYTKLLSEAFPGSNEVKEQYQLAVEKLQSNELSAAKEILLSLLEKYPRYTRAKQLLGVISYLQGDNQLASEYLSDSVDPETANAMTTHIYAATNLKLNEPKKVLEILEPTITSSTVPATFALYGLAAISDRQYVKGEKALIKALELDPNNVRVRLALAGYYRSGPVADSEKEWEQLEKSYELDGNDKQVLEDIVGYHLRHQQADLAEKFLKKALAKDDGDYATNLVAGYFALSQKQVERALGHFTTASIAKAGGDELLQALFAKGKAELSLKKMSAANKTFSDMIRKFPQNELGYKGLLSTYLFDGKEEEGERELESLASRNAQLAPYLVLIQSAVARRNVEAAKRYHDKASSLEEDNLAVERLGRAIRYVEAVIAMKNGNFSEARTTVASILAAEPDDLRLLSFLVELELKAGNNHEASKVLTQMENINPTHPSINLLKGDIALVSQNLASARDYYAQAWKNTPSELAADKLYKALGMMKEKSAQSKHLETWLEASPNSINALMYKTLAYQQRGQRIKAIEGYEKVLQASPNNVMALNNLGWIYFEKDDDRSLDLLKRAVELAPESAAVLDSYGWVLVNKGQVSEGLVYLEKAHKLAPNVAEIEQHLLEARAKQ